MSHLVEKSEVVRLRQRIRMEYEAAVRGLCGLTQGTACLHYETHGTYWRMPRNVERAGG